jgi:succinate dehydrogenase (ubiquinone) cytochrome b560 subunit
VIAFGLGSLYFAGNFEQIHQYLQYNVHPHVMLTLKTLLAFPFVYHTYAGTRHLIWDTGRWLSSSAITRSGYALILLSLITALGVASL